MISYKKAISIIKKNSSILPSKKVSIDKALYKISAKNILSSSKNPDFSYAAFTLAASLCGATFVRIAGITSEEGGYQYLFSTFGYIFLFFTTALILINTSILKPITKTLSDESSCSDTLFVKVPILLVINHKSNEIPEFDLFVNRSHTNYIYKLIVDGTKNLDF